MANYDHVSQYFVDNRGKLLAKVTRRVGPDDAEDVVQEIFLRALKYYPNWNKDKGTFTQWFNGIVRNCILSCKKSQRQLGMFISCENFEDREKIEPFYEDNTAEMQELDQELRVRIEQKKSPARDILYLKYLCDYTPQEIVAKTGHDKYTVYTHIQRFKGELS